MAAAAVCGLLALLAAAGAALESSDPRLLEIERELARRWWVRPASSAWAEARARLLHAARRDGDGQRLEARRPDAVVVGDENGARDRELLGRGERI